MFESFESWTEDQVSSLESELGGAALPEDLRGFLLGVGGGDLGDWYVVPRSGGNGILQEVFAYATARQVRTGGYSEVVPLGYLAMGYGAGGSLCVGLSGDEHGRVFWADYDLAEELGYYHEEVPTRSNDIMRELFVSWADFVADLPRWEVV